MHPVYLYLHLVHCYSFRAICKMISLSPLGPSVVRGWRLSALRVEAQWGVHTVPRRGWGATTSMRRVTHAILRFAYRRNSDLIVAAGYHRRRCTNVSAAPLSLFCLSLFLFSHIRSTTLKFDLFSPVAWILMVRDGVFRHVDNPSFNITCNVVGV